MSRKSRQIEDLNLTRGYDSEDRVERILQDLVKGDHIHHYYRSQREGELDIMGIDFLIYPDKDWCIPLQVKSSFLHRNEHINNHSDIPCVVVQSKKSDTVLAEIILHELGLSLAGLVSALSEV